MTVLNFVTSEQAVYIVTDSSFSDSRDVQPAGYITKAFLLPHLDGIIAGTGNPQFIADWFVRANTGFAVRDTIHLDQFTQQNLVELYAPYRSGGAGLGTTTIYQWGYDREISRMRVFAYRSTNGFFSEELQHGSALKPGYDVGEFQLNSFPADYLEVVERQKAADEALPLERRVGVGGHMIAYWMHSYEEAGEVRVRMSAERFAELSGFERGYQIACGKLQEQT